MMSSKFFHDVELRIQRVSYLHHKPLINVFLSDGGLEVWRLKKAKKELIDNLQVRPAGL